MLAAGGRQYEVSGLKKPCKEEESALVVPHVIVVMNGVGDAVIRNPNISRSSSFPFTPATGH